MKFNCRLILPLLISVSIALPAPLKAEYNNALLTNPSPTELHRQAFIKSTELLGTNLRGTPTLKDMVYLRLRVLLANNMLSKMKQIAQNPNNPHNHRILRTCFGVKYPQVLQQIQQRIGDMMKGTYYVKLTPANPPAADLYGSWVPSTTERAFMVFYPYFYQMSDHLCALALIHEGSHAVFGTRDIFSHDYTPSAFLNRNQATLHDQQVYLGYIENDFRQIRENAPPKITILNADAWFLFAHLAESGFVDISGKPTTGWWLSDDPQTKKLPGSQTPPVAHGATVSKPNLFTTMKGILEDIRKGAFTS